MINLSMADPEHNLRPRLTVMGVGGAGGNAINNMIRCQLEGCDFIAANTDSQALAMSLANRKIQLGVNMSRGLGAGSKAEVGRAAAEEQLNDIAAALEGSDMLFVTAGMGGGTGTGAAPVIARVAREAGILTVGVVTKPFHFEGNSRMRQAESGIAELQQYVDTLIVIPNQNLFRIANERTTFAEAFRLADEVLHCGVRGITDLMVMPGFMNLDFADVKTVMGEMGKAMMGTGEADGDNRAICAAEAAISNPLLDDVSMKGARGVLINITGGLDMTLFEVDQAANRIREEVDPEAQIKVGSTLGENMDGKIRVSVIATGIDAALATRATTSVETATGTGAYTMKAATPKPQQPAQTQATYAQPAYRAPQSQQPAAPVQQVTPSVSAQTSYFTMPQAVKPAVPVTPPATHLPSSHSAAALAAEKARTEQREPEEVKPAASHVPAPEAVAAAEEAIEQVLAPEPGYEEEARAEETAYEEVRAVAGGNAGRQTIGKASSSAPSARRNDTPELDYGSPYQQQQTQQPNLKTRSPRPAAPMTPFDMRTTQLSPSAPQSTQQPAATEQRRQRRAESLFTRITGFGLVRPSSQHHDEDEHAIDAPLPEEMEQAPRLGVNPSDRPSLSSEQPEDLLEIPAFLRRQNNH